MAYESLECNGGIVTFTIPPRERCLLTDAVDDAYKELQATGKIYDQPGAFDFLAAVGRHLGNDTPHTQEAMLTLKERTEFRVLTIAVPPEPRLPATPNYYWTPQQNPVMWSDGFRAIFFGMVGLEGYGYVSQQSGNVWNNVVAIPHQDEVKGASANDKAQLGLHTEDASYNKIGATLPSGIVLDSSYNVAPDVLSVHFLRNPYNIPTMIAAPDLRKLPGNSREVLARSHFLNRTNPGQGGAANDIPLPVSVLYGGTEENPLFRANLDGLVVVEGLSTAERMQAQAALEALTKLMVASTIRLPSQPGDVIFIDNGQVAHGRAEYPSGMSDEDRYGANARWQRRLVGVYDPERLALHAVSSRIVDPKQLDRRIAQLSAA